MRRDRSTSVEIPARGSSAPRNESAQSKESGGCARDARLFALLLGGVMLLHSPLSRLPYIWDEAGYYVPAARDLLLTGSLIPQSTVSNAHPPLVMAWIALWWRVFGEFPAVTRVAMLTLAAFCLLAVFRLAERVANKQIATASTICVALYSVFFMQSSLVHLDLAAAGFTIWGLHSYLSGHRARTWLSFSLAGLAKETAILAPLALLFWEVLCPLLSRKQPSSLCLHKADKRRSFILLASLAPLAGWFGYHYWRTGYLFGNPEFFRYNVAATIEPVRIILAAGIRLWQVTGYMHLLLLTGSTAIAMFFPPQVDVEGERRRIDIRIQLIFAVVIVAYVLVMSVIGGAELARYLLPVLPLEIILCVSTLWRRIPYCKAAIVVIAMGFVSAWFVNPPYGFSFEDNLAYRDYIVLHRDAGRFLEMRYPKAIVLTAWPASDELTRPYLGYVRHPKRVVQIDNFAYEEIAATAQSGAAFNVALVFSTKYRPARSLVARWPAWERLQKRYFGFHRDVPPDAAAEILGGRIVYTAATHGQWIAVIEREQVLDARMQGQQSP